MTQYFIDKQIIEFSSLDSSSRDFDIEKSNQVFVIP